MIKSINSYLRTHRLKSHPFLALWEKEFPSTKTRAHLERTYVCQVTASSFTKCYFSTNEKKKFEQHLLRHKWSSEKDEASLKFFCPVCDETIESEDAPIGFETKEQLREHVKKEHRGGVVNKETVERDEEKPKVGNAK